MKLKKIIPKKLWAFLPFIIYVLVFVMDLFIGMAQVIVKELMVIREGILILAILTIIPILKDLKWVTSKNILIKTRTLFLCVLGIYISSFLLPRGLADPRDYHAVQAPFYQLVLTTIISIGCTGLGILILIILQDIIYFRRRKSTHRNFRLLLLVILVFCAFTIIQYYRSETHFNSPKALSNSGTVGLILLVLTIMLMVINSFRNSWINYLNKRQKVRYLFLSLILMVGIFQILSSHNTIAYSLAYEFFILIIGLFLAIYWSMAFIAILFHLPTAGIVDRKIREIQSLHTLSRTISSEFNFNRLVVKINELATEVTEANAAWLEVIEPRSGRLKLVAFKNLNQKVVDWIDSNPADGIGNWVLEHKEPLWINEIRKSETARDLHHLGLYVDSLMAVPVIFYEKTLGVLCVLKYHEFGFIPDDLNMLRAFADQAAVALENARLVQANIEKERLAHELKIAHEAQMKLLPKDMPYLSGLDIDAVCITAQDVGGDYYDFFLFSDNRVGIVIGDVSGKGSEAAFYMAEVKGIIKSLAHTYSSPREVLIRTNDILSDTLEQHYFISLIYAVIDLNDWQLTFSRAGHCPLLYGQAQSTEVQMIEPKGIGIGLTRGPLFSELIEEKQLALNDGDALLFYTDGVVEAMNARREEFEEYRLVNVFNAVTHLNSQTIKNKLVTELKAFVGSDKTHDDLTMVVVKVQHSDQVQVLLESSTASTRQLIET